MGKRSEGFERKGRANSFKHGHRYANNGKPTRTYNCWASMLKRCCNQSHKHPHYKNVTVQESWLNFTGFLEDMGEAPTNSHTLGRIDNSKGYEVNNVRWETMYEQTRNKTNNIVVEGQILKDWCLEKGFNYKTVWRWVKEGKSLCWIKHRGQVLWSSAVG